MYKEIREDGNSSSGAFLLTDVPLPTHLSIGRSRARERSSQESGLQIVTRIKSDTHGEGN